MDRHIEYLLIGHDCVIVPGLGAFVALRQSSRFEGDMLMPPSRSVGFNPDITHNDGLLASSIARRSRISYESACQAIADGVTALRRQLESSGSFTINRVGTLRYDGSLTTFEPAESLTASLIYAGLQPITPTKVKTEQVEAPAEKEVLYIPVSRSIFRAAASIAGLLMIGALCTTTMLVDNSNVSNASVAPSITAPRVETIPPAQAEEMPVLTEIPQESAAETVAEAAVETVAEALKPVQEPAAEKPYRAKKAVAEEVNVAEPAQSSFDEYCIVVGSFNTRSRANKFISSQNDPALKILVQDGRYRVYVETYPTEDEAKAVAADSAMQSRYPGAWVTGK